MNKAPFQGETIGIIAGSGQLPIELINHCKANQQAICVIAFEDHTEQLQQADVPFGIFHLGAVGKAIKFLKQHHVSTITLAGKIERPTFSALNTDLVALKLMKRITAAHFLGDNILFTTICEFLEEHDLNIVGVHEVVPSLLTPAGILGKHKPNKRLREDIEIAVHILRTMGTLDVGQGVIVKNGLVLGIEAIEGTDKLISRCSELRKKESGGVLVKLKKPEQEVRVDLPTIGVDTVKNIDEAGFKAIAVEAGGSLIVEREEVIAEANKRKIVLVGVES